MPIQDINADIVLPVKGLYQLVSSLWNLFWTPSPLNSVDFQFLDNLYNAISYTMHQLTKH